jgi:hypothetical protein
MQLLRRAMTARMACEQGGLTQLRLEQFPMRIPPVKAIIAFESVARTKSVNRASEELGLTASAVSHQISNLESIIGQPLFYRSGRGLVLTPTGERYLSDVTG